MLTLSGGRGTVAAWRDGGRGGAVKRPLFDAEVGVHVGHHRGDVFVAQTQGDGGDVDACFATGRERFTNRAEWVSVTTGRRWHLPSSLRFLVAFVASCLHLMQREWTQHPRIWRNAVLSRLC